MQQKYEFKVTPEYAGYTIYDYLLHEMMDFSKNTIKKMLHQNIVRINGEQVSSTTRLKEGDEVKVKIPPNSDYSAEPIRLDILFENDDFLAINKPAGIPVIAERWTRQNLFRDALLYHFQESGQADCSPRFVHRLDKETSGVVIVAKTGEVERYISSLFENRKILKEYLAVVSGIPEDKGRIDLKIAQQSKHSSKMIISEFGKKAVTEYEVLETFGDFALLKVVIVTGRTHQIRVHLASQGYPLAVDSMYGYRSVLRLSEIKAEYKPKKAQIEKPIISRVPLHSYRIAFALPDEQPFQIEAPLPDDMKLLIKMLRKYRPKPMSLV